MTDLTQALTALQNRALVATANARGPADLLAVQRDMVTGAARLVAALEAQPPAQRPRTYAATLAAAREYHAGAQAALARLERHRLQTPHRWRHG